MCTIQTQNGHNCVIYIGTGTAFMKLSIEFSYWKNTISGKGTV